MPELWQHQLVPLDGPASDRTTTTREANLGQQLVQGHKHMKNRFAGYYRPDFVELWHAGVFSYDSSTLLDLYRSSKQTREVLFQLVEALKDQTFVAYQAGLEFQRNRLNVIASESVAHTELAKCLNSLENNVAQYLSRHSFEFAEDLRSEVAALAKKYITAVTEAKQNLQTVSDDDEIRDRLSQCLSGRIGEQLPQEELTKVYADGAIRYAAKLPPGYMDRKEKLEPECYGDLVIWEELKRYAKEHKKPIIFVTSDEKEDWFWEHSGKTIGPRPELVEEMRREAGVVLYIYKPRTFMEYGSQVLQLKAGTKDIAAAVTELKKLEKPRTYFLRCKFCGRITRMRKGDTRPCLHCGAPFSPLKLYKLGLLPMGGANIYELMQQPIKTLRSTPGTEWNRLALSDYVAGVESILKRPLNSAEVQSVQAALANGIAENETAKGDLTALDITRRLAVLLEPGLVI